MTKIKKMLISIMIVLMVIGVVPEEIAGLKTCVEVQAATTVTTPKLVSAKASGTSKVKVTWKKISVVSGYRLYRSTDGKSWKTVKTISGSSNAAYTDSKLKPGTRYYYTVKAYKKVNGKTYWSKYDTKGVYAVTGLAIPTYKVSKSKNAKNAIDVTINPVIGAQGYLIYRRTGNGSSWSRIAVIKGSSYTDRNVKAGTTYTYTVKAYRAYSGKNYYSSYNKKGLKYCIEVPVTPTPIPIIEVEFIELNKTQCTLYQGQSEQLEVSYYPVNADVYKDTEWSSSNDYIVSVDDYGIIVAENLGTATIYADYDGITTQCVVTVEKNKETLKNEAYQTYKEERDALYTDVNNRYKAELNATRDSINNLISDYQTRINELRREGYYYGSESSYKSEQSTLTREVNSLKAQVAALAGSSNPSSIARRAKLQAELDKKQAQLDELERKYQNKRIIDSLQDQINSLKNSYDSTMQRILNKYQNEFDTKVAQLDANYQAEIDRINNLY